MTNRRKFLKSMAGTAVLTGISSAAHAATQVPTGNCAAALTLQPEMEGAGLVFSTDGISLKGGHPSLNRVTPSTKRNSRPGTDLWDCWVER